MIEHISILKSSPSLGLVGDGDDVDLLSAIESSFAVNFGHETASWITVDDIYQALLNRFPVATEVGKCATMMAFHQVRNALSLMAVGINTREIAPATKLSQVVVVSQKRLFRKLSSSLALRLPDRTLSWIGLIGLFSTIAGFLSLFGLFAYPRMWPLLMLLLTGPLMVIVDPGRFGPMTVGDLSRAIARDNFHYFVQSGADHRSQWVWMALCSVIGQECHIEPSIVTPDTRLVG